MRGISDLQLYYRPFPEKPPYAGGNRGPYGI